VLDEPFAALSGAPSPDTASSSLNLEETERAHILRVLEQCAWKIKGPDNAAERLGLNPSTLRSRMVKLGIRKPPPT
jgi:formate hydrogenlyase transcriptional activator